MTKNLKIVHSYFEAVAKGDFDTVGKLVADNVVWHQPGKGAQSGTYKGKDKVFAHLENFMKWSGGTFAVDKVDYMTENGDMVVAAVHFKAEKDKKNLSMKGIDLLRIEDEKIKEVWLFSEKIEDEDEFWDAAAK